jgi:hypothetical protein
MISRYGRSEQAQLDISTDNAQKPIGGDAMTVGEYLAMLGGMIGELTASVSRFQQLVELGKDRTQTVMVSSAQNFGATHNIPRDMKNAILARPTRSEQLSGFGSDLYFTIDGGESYKIPPTGMTIIPVGADDRTFTLTSPGVPPTNWAIWIKFTNRQLNVGVNV